MCDVDRYPEDKLDAYYDIVLLGTGLVQSILSCVASKHGKKVLHMDKNDFYGEVYGSHNLSAHLSHYRRKSEDVHVWPSNILRTSSVHNSSQFELENNLDDVFVAYFLDNVSHKKVSLHPRRLNKSELQHPCAFGYTMERISTPEKTEEFIHPVFRNYAKHNKLTCARVWNKDRDFNIDTTSKVLFGSSSMVDLMIASGVGNYLEFKSFEGLYFMVEGGDDRIWKVPCSRTDVFNTTMLGALEKRSLMKFHQFVADWGRVNCGTEVTSLNESELAIGRSLYRPQNKQLASSGYNVDAFIDQPFEDFLTDCKISPKLQRIVIYALCCHKAPMRRTYLTRDALNDMYMHIDSIGRFGETAFLTPLYGASEVVQAFCRMSAVWGGTFVLQRTLVNVAVSHDHEAAVMSTELAQRVSTVEAPARRDSKDSVQQKQSNAACCVAATAAADDDPSPVPTPTVRSGRLTVTDSAGNLVSCDAFVCGASQWPGAPTSNTLKVSCTSVWLGAVVPLPRSIIIIPPGHNSSIRCDGSASSLPQQQHQQQQQQLGIGNSHAVHIIQTDSSTNSAPEGAVVLHMSTLLEIKDAAGTETGSMDWRSRAQAHSKQACDMMERVISKLVESFATAAAKEEEPANKNSDSNLANTTDEEPPLEELSRVVTIQPVYDLDNVYPPSTAPWTAQLPPGVRLCSESSDASLSMQSAYEDARKIFSHLFPGKDFSLNVVDEVPTDVHRFPDSSCENDDEAAFLEFALTSAQTETEPKTESESTIDISPKPL